LASEKELGGNIPPPPGDSPAHIFRWYESMSVWWRQFMDANASAREDGSDDSTGAGSGSGGGSGGGGGSDDGGPDSFPTPIVAGDKALSEMMSAPLFLSLDGTYKSVPGATGLDPTFGVLEEEFSRLGAAGDYGEKGWTATGTVAISAAPDRAGSLDFTSGAIAGDATYATCLGVNLAHTTIDEFRWVFKVDPITSAEVYVGMGVDDAIDFLGADAIGFYYVSSGSTNIFAYCRGSSTNTAVDTGVALQADKFTDVRASRQSDGSWRFFINDAYVATVSTNIPTVELYPMFRVQTNAAAAKVFTAEYFGIRMIPGVRYET